MATGGPGFPIWDKQNEDQQGIVCLTPTYRDLLTKKRPDLMQVIQLDDLWPHLRKYQVLTATTEQRLKVRNVLRPIDAYCICSTYYLFPVNEVSSFSKKIFYLFRHILNNTLVYIRCLDRASAAKKKGQKVD